MKIPAIVEMEMKFSREGVILNGVLIREGETVTVDGTKGYLHIGEEKAIPLETTLQARELLEKILK
jgi:phosphoenolpyruvate synthase/pyruvate phosphate dikinase